MTRRRRASAKPYYREGRGWYGNLRSFGDVGGRQEALIPDGEHQPTQNETEAYELFAKRLAYYKALRKGHVPEPEPGDIPTLREYMSHHFAVKDLRAISREREEGALTQLCRFPRARGGDIRLDAITPAWVMALRVWRKGLGVSARTRQLEEGALSNLLDLAVREAKIPANPLRSFPRIKAKRHKAVWLEPEEVRRFLDEAKAMDAAPRHNSPPFLEILFATAVYTGTRRNELLGFEVHDVDFEAGVIHVRPNAFRPDLKTEESERAVPLWSELRRLLVAHVGTRTEGLLFAGRDGGILRDLRGSMHTAVERAEIQKRVTWHTFRHTYTAMRLQTLDNGQPVSPWTVKAELGHTSLALLERTYGHLMENRLRRAEVSYRPPLTLVQDVSA